MSKKYNYQGSGYSTKHSKKQKRKKYSIPSEYYSEPIRYKTNQGDGKQTPGPDYQTALPGRDSSQAQG